MSKLQIKESELKEFAKMMNWGISNRDILKFSVYTTNDRVYISTVEHAPKTGEHKTVMGNGKDLFSAMKSFTETRNAAIQAGKIFNSNQA